jgi:hypothetical protein
MQTGAVRSTVLRLSRTRRLVEGSPIDLDAALREVIRLQALHEDLMGRLNDPVWLAQMLEQCLRDRVDLREHARYIHSQLTFMNPTPYRMREEGVPQPPSTA